MAYVLPNSDIKTERPKRKHQYEDAGYEPTEIMEVGQLIHLDIVAGARPTASVAGAGEKCYPCIDGITAAELASGKWCTLRLAGEARVITALALGGGQEIQSDANGNAVALVTGAGNYCGGFLQSGSNAPDHAVALEVESYFT